MGGDLEPNLLPFTGPLELPSSEATLKLYFFYRNSLGKKNSKISQQDIVSLVVTQVVKYWEMAGYKDMLMMKQDIWKEVMKELSKYQISTKST